jgi:hypothetical protein
MTETIKAYKKVTIGKAPEGGVYVIDVPCEVPLSSIQAAESVYVPEQSWLIYHIDGSRKVYFGDFSSLPAPSQELIDEFSSRVKGGIHTAASMAAPKDRERIELIEKALRAK